MKNPTTNFLFFLFAVLISLTSVFADQFVNVNQDASATTDLVCDVVQSATDNGYIFTWYKDGRLLLLDSNVNPRVLSSERLTKGETWTCVVSISLGRYGIEELGSDSTVIRNSLPVIETIPNFSINTTNLFLYQVQASDADLEVLTYSLVSAPAGMTISQTGGITWLTSASDAGLYTITVQVSDSTDSVTRTFTILVSDFGTITVTPSATPMSACVNTPINFGASVTGVSPFTFAWDFENDGFFDSLIQNPTHTYTTIGNHTARFFVTDAFITVETRNCVSPLTLVASATPSTGNEPLTSAFTATATGGVPGYTFAWDSDNDGSFDDSAIQNPTFIFQQNGTYLVRVRVTDSELNTAVSQVTITVTNDAPTAPTFSTSSCPSATANETYRCDINAHGVGAITYSLLSRPNSNMTINSSTGVITWTPKAIGTFNFTVRATDSATALFSDRTYSIRVYAQIEEEEKETIADEDDLFVDSIIFETEQVAQGGEILARVTLENQGDIDFEDLKINMGVDELGIQVSTAKFDLNDGKKTTKELLLELPSQVTEGYYLVKFVVSNDDIKVTKYKEIFISGVSSGSLSAAEFVVEPSITAYSAPAQKSRLNWFAIWFMLFVLIALVILLAYLTRRVIEEDKNQKGTSTIVELDKDFY